MNAYNYQANSPLAHNESGADVTKRGDRTEAPISTNAGSVHLTEEEKEREVVVAILDSGVLAEHEDLKDILWENPGDIGLEGEHGYNFYNNNTDLTPTLYHETHCSGIIAAGNHWTDLDNNGSDAPATGDSPYKVTVGAADITGRPASFTNYGKSSVQVFAPGVNILSTVSYKCYFPNIYSPDRRNDTTEYYGLFDGSTVIGTDSEGNSCVAPFKGDAGEDVKCFGASVFHAQPDPYSAFEPEGTATYELSVSKDRSFTASDDPGSLKLTSPVIDDAVCDLANDTLAIHGAHMNEGFTLRYKKLEDKSAEEITLPSGDMESLYRGTRKIRN